MSAHDYAFLHGGGQGGWVWEKTIDALARQTDGAFGRALVLDVPGCGAKRGRDTSGVGVDDIAAELLDDIQAAGLTDVVLVGHSQAGSIIPRMTAARPDLFRRLVYVTCSSPLPGQSVVGMMGTSLQGSNPDEVGWPVDPRTHSMAERFAEMFCNDMGPEETDAFLSSLGPDAWPPQSYTHTDWRYDHLDQVPTSYVACLRDRILPVQWQEVFAARFKATRLIRIDAGHQVMNTRPHTLAEVLRIEAAVD